MKNFEARNGKYERNAVIKNPGDKTAWTKNSRRLLAVGVQRAVSQRRQLQKKMDQLENYLLFARKWFWNVCIWLVLGDLMFCGQWTNLHDRLHNGLNRVTNDYVVWSLTFIIHVNANSIAMWETLPNNADSKTQNRLQGVVFFCIFGSHTFVPISWMRNNLLFHTVWRFCVLMWVCAWMGFPLLVCGIYLVIEVLHSSFNQPQKSKENVQGDLLRNNHQTSTPTSKPRLKISTTILRYPMSIMFSQTWSLLNLVRCITSLKTMKQWSGWSFKGRTPTMRHVSRTHRVALDGVIWPNGKAEAGAEPGLAYCGKLFYSTTAASSSASNRPRILRAPSQQGSNLIAQSAGKPATWGSSQHDTASSSQVWQRDAKTNERAREVAAAGANQDPSFQERGRNLAAENPEIIDEDDSKWPHNYRISRDNVPHLEKVYSNLRPQLKRKKTKWRTSMWIRWYGGNVYDCHPASRSSSRKRLFG